MRRKIFPKYWKSKTYKKLATWRAEDKRRERLAPAAAADDSAGSGGVAARQRLALWGAAQCTLQFGGASSHN